VENLSKDDDFKIISTTVKNLFHVNRKCWNWGKKHSKYLLIVHHESHMIGGPAFTALDNSLFDSLTVLYKLCIYSDHKYKPHNLYRVFFIYEKPLYDCYDKHTIFLNRYLYSVEGWRYNRPWYANSMDYDNSLIVSDLSDNEDENKDWYNSDSYWYNEDEDCYSEDEDWCSKSKYDNKKDNYSGYNDCQSEGGEPRYYKFFI
jgi:hypothetical protein